MRHSDVNEAKAASEAPAGLRQLNERSREIFKRIVEAYLATGEPVGSRNLSGALPMTLSPASVRNVMSDLEGLGLIYAPHTSAGRLPTHSGLRLFIDGLLEIGDISNEANDVLTFFAIAFVLNALALWYYARSFALTAAAVLCSAR